MTESPSLPGASGAAGGDPTEPTYTVGYRRPPVQFRFKPGESGNRKGRPKRQRNVRTVVEETLNQRIRVREGDGTRSLTKLDGVVLTMVNAALKGDSKAQATLITLVRSVGLMGDAPEAAHSGPLTANDEALIADFIQRQSASSEQPDGTAVDKDPVAPEKGVKS
jgi:hypothetical protein